MILCRLVVRWYLCPTNGCLIQALLFPLVGTLFSFVLVFCLDPRLVEPMIAVAQGKNVAPAEEAAEEGEAKPAETPAAS